MAGLVGSNVPTDDMPEHTEVLLWEIGGGGRRKEEEEGMEEEMYGVL